MTTFRYHKLPLEKFKRTKIIATVGPATNSQEKITEMLKNGVNGFRLNFSHGKHEERDQQIKWIRKASKEAGKPVAIIADLQGPQIACGEFDGFIPIKRGQMLSFNRSGSYSEGGAIPVQYDLSKKVKRGERLLIADGRIRAVVDSVNGGIVYATAQNDGVLTQRKGISLPDTDFGGYVFTPKDKKDIVYVGTQDIDYLAVSFVQTAEDVIKARILLKNQNSDAMIISKIETAAAVENLDSIIAESDGVMVARGDLAVETVPEAVPVVQRQIIGKCMEQGKISIVATQMLVSMTEELEPTRAEVSDVATAVIVGSDAVMLSEETAIGKYPIETIQMMKRIILHTQINSPLKPIFYGEEDTSVQGAISTAMIKLAHQIEARAIVVATKTGATAKSTASHRPNMPIITVSESKRVTQQLALLYGGMPHHRTASAKATTKVTDFLRVQKVFKKDDLVVISSGQYPGKVGGTDTIKVRRLS